MKALRRFSPALLACAITLLRPGSLLACVVCFGDTNSAMVKGANAGILILLGVVGIVLGSIVGVTLFWIHRARLYQRKALISEVMASAQGRFRAQFSASNGKLVVADAEG